VPRSKKESEQEMRFGSGRGRRWGRWRARPSARCRTAGA